MSESINTLQDWYARQCDGTWEHSYGLEIVNIDNPGWKVKITGAQQRAALEIKTEASDLNWITVRASESEFIGYGGPANLNELLELARRWVQ